MKFLITGSIRSARGPRLIVTWTLFGLLAFFVAFWLREFFTIGFWPGDMAAGIRGDEFDAGRGLVSMLEDLHVDLLTHAVLLLFLTSLLFQLPHSLRLKKALAFWSFVFCFLYVTARAAVLLSVHFSYLAFGAGLAFAAVTLVLFVLTLLYLFQPDAR